MYPLIKNFLVENKDCCQDYSGFELHIPNGKSKLRADVYGVTNGSDKSIFLCEGKRDINRSFGKVVGEAIELLKFGNFVYVFGPSDGFDFESNDQIEKCRTLGIGVLIVDWDSKVVKEVLSPQANNIQRMVKKEILLRIFLKDLKKPISKLIFQGGYEFILNNRDTEKELPCVRYLDVYNSIFVDESIKDLIRKIIDTPTRHHTLIDRDVRKAFQSGFGRSPLVNIQKSNDKLEDIICYTKEGIGNVRAPILLDAVQV